MTEPRSRRHRRTTPASGKQAQKQVETVRVTVQSIMRTCEFARGFGDARKGLPFDWRIGAENDEDWSYERGRLLAHIAPLNMPPRIGSKLNPKAVALYAAASKRRLVI
jgi:hypothetical protein